MTPIQVRERAWKALAEGRLDKAISTARFLIAQHTTSDLVPDMRRVVAEVYEKKGLKDDVLKAYQQLLSLHPRYEKAVEIKRRMQKIRRPRQPRPH